MNCHDQDEQFLLATVGSVQNCGRYAAIDIAAVQQRPRVKGPAAIDTARWSQQGDPDLSA
jgi:hypothetical protein